MRRRIHGIVCFGERAANSPIFFFEEKKHECICFWVVDFFLVGGLSVGEAAASRMIRDDDCDDAARF